MRCRIKDNCILYVRLFVDMENEMLSRLRDLNIQGIENIRKIPREQDRLIAYATVPGMLLISFKI